MTVPSTFQLATSTVTPMDLFEHGRLPKSGQFLAQSKFFSASEITQIFSSLKSDLCGATPPLGVNDWYCVQNSANGNINGTSWIAKTSALVVEFLDTPSFLDSGNPIERRYGYVILTEIELNVGGSPNPIYLFVQRLHLDDPCSKLALGTMPVCDPLGFETFLEPFTDNDSRIESIAMRPMGISRMDLRRKVLDAYDVQTSMSSLGLHRIAYGALRVVQNSTSARRILLSPRQRKLKQAGVKAELVDLVQWAAGIAIEFHKAKKVSQLSSVFLRSFAKPTTTLIGAVAQSVLIDTTVLRELLDPGSGTYEFVDMAKAAATSPRSPAIFEELLVAMDDAISLKVIGPGRFLGVISCAHSIQVQIDVRSKTCSLSLKSCDWGVRPRVSSGVSKSSISLGRFINEKKAFRVALNNGTMLFCAEGAYSDGDIKHSAKLLLNIIRPMTALDPVVTEKGIPKPGAPLFDSTSAFHVIENTLSWSHPWLLCDDSNTEWCDFMSLLPMSASSTTVPEVRWYHAKVNRIKDKTNKTDLPMNSTNGARSATGLQEVVGQGIKNLGRIRMHSKNPDVKKRKDFWEENYVWPDASRTASSMPRLKCQVHGAANRTVAAVADFLKAYDMVSSNPHTIFEVALVIPNYKKITLEKAFSRLGTAKGSQTASQIFWLLSGFMQSCLEVGVRPVIYCR